MAVITMVNNKGKVLVDDNDFEWLSKYRWRKTTQGRPMANINGKDVLMHRLILPTKKYVDHINGDFLDNRRSNLREATPQQNQWNRKPGKLSRTGLKGVGWCKQTSKWRVSMRKNGSYTTLGRYDCIGSAMKRYTLEANTYHGEFARTNL